MICYFSQSDCMLYDALVKSDLDYAFTESYELLDVSSFLSSGSGFFDPGSSNIIVSSSVHSFLLVSLKLLDPYIVMFY